MAITREQVDHVALLARLALTEQERDRFAGQLGAIIEFIDKLNEMDTSGVQPMVHGIAGFQPARNDAAGPSLSRDEALRNGPQASEGCFKVPRIIE